MSYGSHYHAGSGSPLWLQAAMLCTPLPLFALILLPLPPLPPCLPCSLPPLQRAQLCFYDNDGSGELGGPQLERYLADGAWWLAHLQLCVDAMAASPTQRWWECLSVGRDGAWPG